MSTNALSKGLLTIGNIIKNVINDEQDVLKLEPDVLTTGKITRLMSKFIISPNVVIDENLRHMDAAVLKDIVHTNLSTFTAIVTQAFRILIEVYDVDPTIVIDKMNKGKGHADDVTRIRDLVSGTEGFDYVADLLLNDDGILPATESNKKKGGSTGTSSIGNNAYTTKDVGGFINTYELQFSFLDVNGNSKVMVIPIIIYPNIVFTNAQSLIGNMVDSDSGKTVIDRFHEYKSGLISFSDLILATDLVKKHREKKIKNVNDVATYLNVTDKTTTISDILHNRKHFYRNYNIYILHVDTKANIDRQVKGNIFKDKFKDMFTDAISAFAVTLVDVNQEEATLMIDDLPGFSVLNFNMLKGKAAKDDIGSIVKELVSNRQPF